MRYLSLFLTILVVSGCNGTESAQSVSNSIAVENSNILNPSTENSNDTSSNSGANDTAEKHFLYVCNVWIYMFPLDSNNGIPGQQSLYSDPDTLHDCRNAIIDQSGKFLIVVYQGYGNGTKKGIRTYRINQTTGELTYANEQVGGYSQYIALGSDNYFYANIGNGDSNYRKYSLNTETGVFTMVRNAQNLVLTVYPQSPELVGINFNAKKTIDLNNFTYSVSEKQVNGANESYYLQTTILNGSNPFDFKYMTNIISMTGF